MNGGGVGGYMNGGVVREYEGRSSETKNMNRGLVGVTGGNI
jgi:hypothetical protein